MIISLKHTKEVMRKYLTQTVPYELVKCLPRLNAVSDASWTLYYNAPDSKIEATALTLAGKTAKDIIDVVTNNKPLGDEAFKFSSSSSSPTDDFDLAPSDSRSHIITAEKKHYLPSRQQKISQMQLDAFERRQVL